LSATGSDVSRALRRRKQAAELEQRARVRRPRALLLVAALALVGMAGIAVAARLYVSGYFNIENVRVQGASHLSDDDVRNTAGLTGQSFFLVDTAAAVARLRAMPWVKDARVTVRFPHSATVTIAERTPVGVWRVGAISYLVDADGVVLDAPTDPAAVDGLPAIDATSLGDEVQVGGHVDPDPLQVAQALAAQPPGTVARSVVRLEYDQQNGLSAVTASGLVVRLGDGQDLAFKLAVWQQTLLKVPLAQIHELDLRDGDRPFYR
jgi:cell division septal protein FtsQ